MSDDASKALHAQIAGHRKTASDLAAAERSIRFLNQCLLMALERPTDDQVDAMIRAAYERGANWQVEWSGSTPADPDAYFPLRSKAAADYADKVLSNPGRKGSSDSAALHSDLFELLELLGMPTVARPESPHEVFQSALKELRAKLGTLDAFRERLRTIAHAAKCEEGESAFSLSCVVDACHALASEGLRMSDDEREAFLNSSAPDMRSPRPEPAASASHSEPPHPTSVRILMSDGSTFHVSNQVLEARSDGPGHQPRGTGSLRPPPTTGSGVKPSGRPPLWMR